MTNTVDEIWRSLDSFFPATVLGNWAQVIFLSLVLTLILKTLFRFFSARLRRVTRLTSVTWDDIGIDLLDGLRSFVLFIWLLTLFSKSIDNPSSIQKIILTLAVATSVYQVGLWGLYLIRLWRDRLIKQKSVKDPSAASALGIVSVTLQALFLTVIVLVGLSNLGVDIAALIAGLGVGGIAVALAAQNILGDLLASLSIVLDKPFVVGDFIITGADMGTVEQIGIKTTRVRSLSGEELVFSNKDLLESRIRNYKRMWQRRVILSFSVSYLTPPEKVAAIPSWVKAFVEKQDRLRFDRCHLAKLAQTSLDFELVFWVSDPNFNVFMDLQQQVLLDILNRFQSEKIDFAYRSFFVREDAFGFSNHQSESPAPR